MPIYYWAELAGGSESMCCIRQCRTESETYAASCRCRAVRCCIRPAASLPSLPVSSSKGGEYECLTAAVATTKGGNSQHIVPPHLHLHLLPAEKNQSFHLDTPSAASLLHNGSEQSLTFVPVLLAHHTCARQTTR